MTSARDVIAAAGRRTGLLVNDKYKEITVAVGEENADAILAALDAAGYAVAPKEPTEAIRWSVVKHVPETELSAADLYRAFIKAVEAAKLSETKQEETT